MRQLRRIQFTRQGFEDSQKKLEELAVRRVEVVKELARARELGDLSENGLYKAARQNLSSIDHQMRRLKFEMKLADIVEDTSTDEGGIGRSITVKVGDQTITYHIVGDLEANPTEKKISQHSPIGKALVGKKKGEIAVVETPRGKTEFEIVKIS